MPDAGGIAIGHSADRRFIRRRYRERCRRLNGGLDKPNKKRENGVQHVSEYARQMLGRAAASGDLSIALSAYSMERHEE